MNLPGLMESLGLTAWPAHWADHWDTAAAEYAAQGCVYVQDAWLDALQAEFDLFVYRKEVIYRGAASIRGNEPLCRFIVLLHHALKDRAAFNAQFKEYVLPAPPAAKPTPEEYLPYDMAAFFAMLGLCGDAAARMRARRVPEEVVRETLRGYDLSLVIWEGESGRPGYNVPRLNWARHFYDLDLLTVGRFNFQPRAFNGCVSLFRHADGRLCCLMRDVRLHREGMLLGSPGFTEEEGAFDADFTETDTYWEGCPVEDARARSARVRLPKNEWTLLLSPGDPVLGIHIPPIAPFDREVIQESYRRAAQVFRHSYPEFKFKAIVTATWLLDPQLKTLLRSGSNIAGFLDDYLLYPWRSSGRAVFHFVFHNKPYPRCEDLPEDTSLMRAVKKLYLAGGCIHETGGVLLSSL